MSDGFTVDYTGLGDLGQQLENLRAELDSGKEAVDPLLNAVGDDGLRHELSEFVDNWGDKKKEICDHLAEVSGLAVQAADAYGQVDGAFRDGFNGCAAGS